MSHLNFEYVPLTFISDQEEIRKQIRNTLILIHLFEKYGSPNRLEKLIEGTQYGYNASALKSGRNKFLRISDIHESKVNWRTVPYCDCDDEEIYLLKKDDILIARTGGTTGKSFKIDNPPAHSIYAGYLIRIRAKQEVNPEYIYLFLHSFSYWSQIVNLNARNFRPKANAENLKSLILPDCPTDIQNDAVKISNGESVKGYEGLYSEIEKVLAEYDKAQEVQGLLSDQLTQLKNLNQAVLQEAVRGKLVKQDLKDEPASKLLHRIKAEKAKLGKNEKAFSPIKPEEIPFDIPQNWVWCRLGEICSKIGSGSTPKGSNYAKNGFPFFRSQNIYNDGLVYDDIKFVSEEVQKQMSGTIVLANDILLNITGGSMGRCALVPNDFEEGNVSQHVCIIRPLLIDRNYFHKIVLSPYFQKFIFSSTTGAGREGLPKYNLEQFAIPLPPVSEQKRIVAEIGKQFAKIKQLEEHVIAIQQATDQLLKTLLHQAFEVKKIKEHAAKPNGKVIGLKPTTVNWDNLAAEPCEKYVANAVNNIQNIDWELAIMVACMKNKLGVTYGDVGLQKTVFNTDNLQPVFSKKYGFVNSNFGTYSYELKDDLKRNPYLTSQKVSNNKEVYVVNSKYNKQILDKLSAPENKEFVRAINNMLNIYEHPFINKETDKIELYNTVLKVALDKNTRDINVIYLGMKEWLIEQKKFKTKAEKFTKSDSLKMLNLLINKKVLE